MRVGLYGGSFNPAHEGHAHVARTAQVRLGLDRVIWLVTPGNPLKTPPGDLAVRVRAVRAVMADPAMIAEAQHLNLEIRPKPASEVEALVARAAATPLAIRQRAAAILGWK